LLLGGKSLLQLQVSDRPGGKPVTVYSTDDAEFMRGIQDAMNQAVASAKSKRVV